MSNIEKANVILEKIDTMKGAIAKTLRNPYLPEAQKLKKIRDMEAILKDAQAYALVFLQEISDDLEKSVA